MNKQSETIHYHDVATHKELIDVSIVIPVYNGALTIKDVVAQTIAVMSLTKLRFEIVLVNDGGRDNSWEVIQGLQSEHSESLIAIDLMRNFGQHNAVMCGFRESSGRLVVTMDDDLQHPPSEIPKLVAEIESKQLDLVYGIYKDRKHNFYRSFSSELIQKFYRLVFKLPNGVSAFRIVHRSLIECVVDYKLNYTYLDGLFAWNTTRIGEIEVEHAERTTGKSGYSLSTLLSLAFNLFTNFSLLPLQIVSVLGFVVAALGLSGGIYYAYLGLIDGIEVPGFASLIIAIMTIGGLQMLSLGVIGEYLGRLHINANRKPQYVARTISKE